MRNVRDHGLGNEPKPLGAPRVLGPKIEAGFSCLNCGCETLFLIQVEVALDLLIGERGTSTYVGCPACPWASPTLTVAVQTKEGEGL